MAGLSQEMIDGLRECFLAILREKGDDDRDGKIDVFDLGKVLEAMGQKPSVDDLYQMVSEVDDQRITGLITFTQFLQIIEIQKKRSSVEGTSGDMLDAYVACGGDADGGGNVDASTLIRYNFLIFVLLKNPSHSSHPLFNPPYYHISFFPAPSHLHSQGSSSKISG